MKYIVVGLGNPGEEYEHSRHNTGRAFVELFAKKYNFSNWETDKKLKAEVAKGEIAGNQVTLLLPNTFMNKSGTSVSHLIKSVKAAERLIVLYDELDLPLGKLKITFGRGAGGHKGVDSIIHSLKTKDFVRVRIGIAPTTPKGVPKKPKGEKKVLDFLMGDFKKPEWEKLKRSSKTVNEALSLLIEEGRAAAMNVVN